MNSQFKLSIALIIALVGFPQISETIYSPALPNVAAGLMASAQSVEATLSIYFLGFALGVALWGAISDWTGRRLAMLLGIVIYAAGTIACGSAQTVESLLAWRFIQAFGASVGSVITQTILRDTYDGFQRAKLFSVVSGALAFSPAIGPVLGGFTSDFFGWRANFWLLTVVAIALFIWTWKKLPETRPRSVSKPSFRIVSLLFQDMTASKTMWGHILLIAATNGIIFSFYQEAPFIFIEQLGMHASLYGMLGILIAAATLLAARVSIHLNKTWTPHRIIQIGSLVATIGSMLFLTLVSMGFFTPESLGMLASLISLFLIFLGIGLVIPNSLSVALKPFQMNVGIAGSIFGGLYYCLIAAFTWLMSLIHNGTVYPLPFFLLALSLVLLLASHLASRRVPAYLDV